MKTHSTETIAFVAAPILFFTALFLGQIPMFIFIFFCALGLCAIIFEAGRRVGMKDGYQQCREDYQI